MAKPAMILAMDLFMVVGITEAQTYDTGEKTGVAGMVTLSQQLYRRNIAHLPSHMFPLAGSEFTVIGAFGAEFGNPSVASRVLLSPA